MRPNSAPTAAVASSPTVMEMSVPLAGAGISVSTLSVETSRIGSSACTASPTAFSHRVTVPSVTDSPSCGSVMATLSPPAAGAAAAGAAGATGAAGAAATGSGAAGAGASTGAGAAGAGAGAPASFAAPMTASWPPTGTVASSGAVISSSTPLAGAGISVSTLSVETSSRGSSACTVSPTAFSQRVTVPSVTLSPSWGMTTGVDILESFT